MVPLERRTVTLLAVVRTLRATAQDPVLDLFDIVVITLLTDATEVGNKAGLRTIRDLASARRRRADAYDCDPAMELSARNSLGRNGRHRRLCRQCRSLLLSSVRRDSDPHGNQDKDTQPVGDQLLRSKAQRGGPVI